VKPLLVPQICPLQRKISKVLARKFLRDVLLGGLLQKMSMSAEKLKFFKEMLSGQIAALLEDAEKTVAEMTQRFNSYPDPSDRASLEADRNFELRLRDRQRKLISKLEEAIARIDAGTYGICEECGCDIGEERLIARPVTTMCIACKTEQEHREKISSE